MRLALLQYCKALAVRVKLKPCFDLARSLRTRLLQVVQGVWFLLTIPVIDLFRFHLLIQLMDPVTINYACTQAIISGITPSAYPQIDVEEMKEQILGSFKDRKTLEHMSMVELSRTICAEFAEVRVACETCCQVVSQLLRESDNIFERNIELVDANKQWMMKLKVVTAAKNKNARELRKQTELFAEMQRALERSRDIANTLRVLINHSMKSHDALITCPRPLGRLSRQTSASSSRKLALQSPGPESSTVPPYKNFIPPALSPFAIDPPQRPPPFDPLEERAQRRGSRQSSRPGSRSSVRPEWPSSATFDSLDSTFPPETVPKSPHPLQTSTVPVTKTSFNPSEGVSQQPMLRTATDTTDNTESPAGGTVNEESIPTSSTTPKAQNMAKVSEDQTRTLVTQEFQKKGYEGLDEAFYEMEKTVKNITKRQESLMDQMCKSAGEEDEEPDDMNDEIDTTTGMRRGGCMAAILPNTLSDDSVTTESTQNITGIEHINEITRIILNHLRNDSFNRLTKMETGSMQVSSGSTTKKSRITKRTPSASIGFGSSSSTQRLTDKNDTHPKSAAVPIIKSPKDQVRSQRLKPIKDRPVDFSERSLEKYRNWRDSQTRLKFPAKSKGICGNASHRLHCRA